MNLHQITVFHIVRFLIGYSIQINDSVLDFQRLSRQPHTTLHIIFTTVYRTTDYFTKHLLVFVDVLTTYLIIMVIHHTLLLGIHGCHIYRLGQFLPSLIAQPINILCRYIDSYCISSREIEYHNIIKLYFAKTFYTLVVPLGPFQIRLGIQNRQSMLRQRHVEWSLRNARAIASLAYKQIIAYQQRLFQRRGRNHIILEEIQIHKINRYQSKDNGIHPAHYTSNGFILRILPPCPRYLLGDIGIKNEWNHYQSQPTFQP